MPRVLFVCTGNICRSPMAEALLQGRLARDASRREWRVDSAGIWAADGRPATDHAVEQMAKRGLDLTAHRSRSVTRELMARADLVLGMTRRHVDALRMAFPEHAGRVCLMSQMAGKGHDVQDPYDGSSMDYARVATELEQLIDGGYGRIVELVEE